MRQEDWTAALDSLKRAHLCASLAAAALVSLMFLCGWTAFAMTSAGAPIKPWLSAGSAAPTRLGLWILALFLLGVVPLWRYLVLRRCVSRGPATLRRLLLLTTLVALGLSALPSLLGFILVWRNSFPFQDFIGMLFLSTGQMAAYLPQFSSWEERLRDVPPDSIGPVRE